MIVKKDDTVLKTIRLAVGLSEDSTDFDTDLLIYINGALSKMRQNGVNSLVVMVDENTTWADLEDPLNLGNNEAAQMFPIFITLSVKIVFDPPPPSTVDYYKQSIDEILWRIKLAYDTSDVI